MSVFFSLWS